MMSRREIEDKVKRVINKNYTKIIYKVDPGPLIRSLRVSGLLTVAGHDGYYEELSKKLENGKTNASVMERLIDILFHRENWWIPLIKALRENENNDTADIIEGALPNSEKEKLIEKPKSKERRQERTRRRQERYPQSEDTDSDWPDDNLRSRSIKQGGHQRRPPPDYSSSSMDSEVEPARNRRAPSSLQNGPSRMQARRAPPGDARQYSLPHHGGNPASHNYDIDFASYVSHNRERVVPSGYGSSPLRHHFDHQNGFPEINPTDQFYEKLDPESQNPNRFDNPQTWLPTSFGQTQFSLRPKMISMRHQPAQGPQNGHEQSIGESVDLGQPRATRQPSTSSMYPDTRTGSSEGSSMRQATGVVPARTSMEHPSASSLPAVRSSREDDLQTTLWNQNLSLNPSPTGNRPPTLIQTQVDQTPLEDIRINRPLIQSDSHANVPNLLPSSNLSPSVQTGVDDKRSTGDSGANRTSNQSDPAHLQPPPPATTMPPSDLQASLVDESESNGTNMTSNQTDSARSNPPAAATLMPLPDLQASVDEQMALLTLETPVPRLPLVVINHLENMDFDGSWKKFSGELTMKITFEDENRIASNKNDNKARQVVQLFHEREGKKATFGKIMAALRKIKRKDVIDGIKTSTGFAMEEESDSDIASVRSLADLDFSTPSMVPSHTPDSEESTSFTDVDKSSQASSVAHDEGLEDEGASPPDPEKDCGQKPQACSSESKDPPQTVAGTSPEQRKSTMLENDPKRSLIIKSQINAEMSENDFTEKAEGCESSIGRRITSIQREKKNKIDENNRSQIPQREAIADAPEDETGSSESDTSDSNNLHMNICEDERNKLNDSVTANMNTPDTKTSPKIKNIGESDTADSDSSISMGSFIPLDSTKRIPQAPEKPEPVRIQQPVTQGLIPLHQIPPMSAQLQTAGSLSYGYPAMPLQQINPHGMVNSAQFVHLQCVPYGPGVSAAALNSVSSSMLFTQPTNPQSAGYSVHLPPNLNQANLLAMTPGNQQPALYNSTIAAGSASSQSVNPSDGRRTELPQNSNQNPDLKVTSTGSLYVDSVSLSDSMNSEIQQIIDQSCGKENSLPPQIHETFANAVLKDKIAKDASKSKSETEDTQEVEDESDEEDNDEDEDEDDDEEDDVDEDGNHDEADSDIKTRKREDGNQTFLKQVEGTQNEETFLKQPYEGPVAALSSERTGDATECKKIKQEEVKTSSHGSAIAAPNNDATIDPTVDHQRSPLTAASSLQGCEATPKPPKVEHAKDLQNPEFEPARVSQKASNPLEAEQSNTIRQAAASNDAEKNMDPLVIHQYAPLASLQDPVEEPMASTVENTRDSQNPEAEHSRLSRTAAAADKHSRVSQGEPTPLEVERSNTTQQAAASLGVEQSASAEEGPLPDSISGPSSGVKTLFKSAVKLYGYLSLGTGDNTFQRWHSN